MSGTQGDETGRRRTRLSPQAREQEIVRAAIGFFAQNGFGGQTRELARAIGVSQALIFRYFPTKEDLIERVYEEVFSKEWRPNLGLLADRSQPLEARLVAFYRDYAGLILGHEYTRLLMFSALNGVNYHERLFARIAAEIYPVLIDELRMHFRRAPLAELAATQNEVEAVWSLHAAIFFVGIREHVFGLDVPPADGMVELKVRIFLQGVPAALAQ